MEPVHLSVEVSTMDRGLAGRIRDASAQSHLPADGILIGEPRTSRGEELHGFPTAEVITFAVTLAASVPVSLFSSWLYDLLKERANQVRIDSREVNLTEDGIKEVVWRLTRSQRRY